MEYEKENEVDLLFFETGRIISLKQKSGRKLNSGLLENEIVLTTGLRNYFGCNLCEDEKNTPPENY